MQDLFRNKETLKNSVLPTSQELESYLIKEILEPWFPACLDREYGGFLCDFDRSWHPNGPQEKLLEFQARQTWIAAEASLAYPGINDLNEAILHGFRFLMDVMWDNRTGGWFHRTDRAGKPLEMGTKHMHGVAYAISTCIVVYAATGEKEALKAARTAFEWLDKHAHDNEYGGYFGFLNRDGKPIKLISQNPIKHKTDTIGTPIGCKDANVHTDLLETFIYLYRVWPKENIKARLEELISIITTRLGTEKGEIHSVCKFDWSYKSAPKGFGYNMQGAHRLLSASQLFPEKNDWVDYAKKLIDYALVHGWDTKNGGMFAGISANETKNINKEKLFWVQMETLWALFAIRKHVPDKSEYNQYLSGTWKYIRQNLTDKYHHGIYESGSDSIPLIKSLMLRSPINVTKKYASKGNIWKDASHEGRALLRSIHANNNRNTEDWFTFPLEILSDYSGVIDVQ